MSNSLIYYLLLVNTQRIYQLSQNTARYSNISIFQWHRNNKARQEKNIIDIKIALNQNNDNMFIF